MAILNGTKDPDTISGNSEDDLLAGFEGADLLQGGNGKDTLVGGDGADTLFGGGPIDEEGDGPDFLFGEGGNDFLRGGGGNDMASGGGGNDTAFGGDGADIYGLSGERTDYAFSLEVAANETSPATIRIRDLRPDSPDGTDLINGFETIRFASGAEVDTRLLASLAPTDIRLTRTPLTGPEISENAGKGDAVALLTAVDPDLGDRFTFSLVDDAGGRFAIDGDRLVVARSGALDFEQQAAHQITIRAKDIAGNQVDKTVSIAVTDASDVFSNFSATLPTGAIDVRLWDQDDNSIVMTWAIADSTNAWFARRVDGSGATLDPDNRDTKVFDLTASGGQRNALVGVDETGNAVLVREGGDNESDVITWASADTGAFIKADVLGSVEIQDSQSRLFLIQASDGTLHFDGRPMGEDGTALSGQADGPGT